MDEWDIVTTGLRFPEGPVACADGSVIVTEIAAGRLTRCRPDGSTETVAETGGGPNGLAWGPDGALYVCNNGGFVYVEAHGLLIPHGTPSDYAGGSIQRVDVASGRVETLYAEATNAALRGPNDIVFDRYGGFWFTDFGKTMNDRRTRDVVGVFYAKADGSSCREIIFPLENPNGIGLSGDGRTLFVAETFTNRLWAFDVVGPGEIAPQASAAGNGGRFVYSSDTLQWFDSLGVEASGNACVATIGAPGVGGGGECGISVVAPDGALVEFVATDDPYTTNICWGGADMMTAYVTLSGTGRLARRQWARPGVVLDYAR